MAALIKHSLVLRVALPAAALALVWTCRPSDEEPASPEREQAGRAAAFERRPAFYRLDPLVQRAAPCSISLEATYDTQPALAVDAGGTVHAVWIGHDRIGHDGGGGDRLWSARLEDGAWSEPAALPLPGGGEGGQFLRPVLAPLGSGLACFWTATGETTGIWMARAEAGGAWSPPVRTTPDGRHQNPEVAADPSGGVWLTWQAAAPGGFDVLLAHLPAEPGAELDEPRVVSGASGAHWDPAVACGPDGAVTVVWSRFERGDYDLWSARLEGTELGPARALTRGGDYDLHPDAAAGSDGRVWVTWDRMQLEHHGASGLPQRTEDGALVNVGIGTRSTAEVGLLCLDGERRLTSATPSPGPPRTHRVENAAYPRVAVEPGGAVWIGYRAWRVKLDAPHSYWWDTVVMQASAAGWSRPEVLARSDGNLEEPALVVAGGEVVVAAAMEHRVSAMPGNPHPEDGARSYAFDHHWNLAPQGDSGEVYASVFAAGGTVAPEGGEVPGGAPELRPVPQDASAGPAGGDGWVERPPERHAIEVDGERFELYFGDTHRHSNISRCTAGGDSTIEDHHRFARDVMRLDFLVISDHSGQTSDFNWWTLCKAAELHHRPGEQAGGLVTLFGYEISCAYPTGHKNLVFPERPDRPLRLGLDGVASGPAIWAHLESSGARAITIPHTTAMPAGTDWEDHDPRYERLVEVFQARTGSSEHAGAPRLATSATNAQGFVQRALDRGYRLGFIASTDHGHGAAYACVYARGATREDVFEALHARRCYGATSYGTVLDVRANGRPMGSELEVDGPVELTIEASAPTPLARAVVFAGSREAARFELEGTRCELRWTDPEPGSPGSEAGGERGYYVRLELENDELAWSSPIWVTW